MSSSFSNPSTGSNYFINSFVPYYIKYCKPDPKDSRFQICKTVIRNKQGKIRKEERIPFGSESSPFHQSFSPIKDSSSNGQNVSQKEDKKLVSGKLYPYQKNTSCETYAYDRQYLICKQALTIGSQATKQNCFMAKKQKCEQCQNAQNSSNPKNSRQEVEKGIRQNMKSQSWRTRLICMLLMEQLVESTYDIAKEELKMYQFLTSGGKTYPRNANDNEQKPNKNKYNFFTVYTIKDSKIDEL